MNERIKEQSTVEKLFWQVMGENPHDPLNRFAELVRKDERELCAKVCEEMAKPIDDISTTAQWIANSCAAAIRGRTE